MPYVGLRAHVADPAASPTPAPAKLVVSVPDAPLGEVVFETIFTEYPEPYGRLPGSKVELEKIRFVDRAGVAHEAAAPAVLEGSPGYTVHIDDEAQDAAELDVTLEPLTE